MIEVTPFVNPFKKAEKTVDGLVIKEVIINGKTYKKIIKK